ncbi:MAG: hypothetical protein ACXAC7_13495 [Candidatus Hodarchaeales archaeon]|jgi:centractin
MIEMSNNTVQNYLILDFGSQHIKAGYSGEGFPRFILPSVVGYNIIEPNKQPLISYDALYAKREKVKLVYPFQEKTVSSFAEWDWNAARDLLSAVIKQLKINPKEYYVVYIEPMHSGTKNTKRLVEFLKDIFAFPHVFVYKQPHLALQVMKRQSALIIELGHSMSSIVAYYKGFEIETTKTFFLIAGGLIADHWAKKLEKDLKTDQPISTYELVRPIDKHFYMAKNYDHELERYERGLLNPIEINLPFSARPVTIKEERFTIPEALFKPELINQTMDGFATSLEEAIAAIPIDTRPEILESVILSGGLSKLKGLDERIKEELRKRFPKLEINILTHQRREITSWIAADMLCTDKVPAVTTSTRDLIFPMPEVVTEFYNETVRCEEAKLWLATSILIKKTLEAVIKDLNDQQTSVFNVLIEFRNFGIINEELMVWANNLEIFKNLNAPPMIKDVSNKRITEELDFLQALLEILYKIRPKLIDHLKEKRYR